MAACHNYCRGIIVKNHVMQLLEFRDLCLSEDVIRQVGSNQIAIASLCPIVRGRLNYLVETVIDIEREANRAVARNCPRRSSPDNDKAFAKIVLKLSLCIYNVRR